MTIIVFHPLSQEHLHGIAKIQIKYLQQRLEARNLGLMLTESALDQITKSGYDPVYGARPLRRTIQTQIENPLAKQILSGKFHDLDEIIVDWSDGQFDFHAKPQKLAVAI